MSRLLVQLSLVICLVSLTTTLVMADLNSGVDDDDDSLDIASRGEQMKHREDIINSLPRMPIQEEKKPVGKLQVGIKKRADSCKHQAQKGDTLEMHYRGYLKQGGAEFDNSYKRGQPLEFKLGTGRVIKGWDQGLLGICAGEKRKLVIPPHLAYGEMGSPPTIPPDSTLVFEVEAVKVRPANREDL